MYCYTQDESKEYFSWFTLDIQRYRCKCGYCVPMKTGSERLCFLEVPNRHPKMKTGKICIGEEEDFKSVRTCKEDYHGCVFK